MRDEDPGSDRTLTNSKRLRKSKRAGQTESVSSLILPPSSLLSRWGRAILGTLLVLLGLATALFTLFARRLGAPSLAGAGAIASLIFVLLITILVVPPLTRSAFAEIS